MNKLHTLILLICTAAPAAFAGGPACNIAATAAVAADQLAFQAAQIDAPGKFPRALFTDYSIPQVAEHLGVEPAQFSPHVDLRKHPSLSEYLSVRYGDYSDWTSGFFPGSLWLAYELTGRDDLRQRATEFTNQLLPVSYMTTTHDLGFMVGCSYGNALRLAPNDSIKEVIVRTADNLISRFDPAIGCIRSWDFGTWNFPVIIDNMMNLQLLFTASKLTGDQKYTDIAVRHADKTLACHFRPDFTSFHVVSYTPDGGIEWQGTFQGKADSSSWARGQAWAVYGFTDCYRETRREEYLRRALDVADMIMGRNQTADLVPLWDFDARTDIDSPRDASAGAIIASALLELSTLLPEVDAPKYRDYAKSILASLCSEQYLAAPGTNGGFLLKHSTGSLPHGSEIDTPLSYADYYFLEALCRLRRIEG